MLRALLELSRISNLPTVWTNVLAAWIIASGGDWKWAPSLGWLLFGASLLYSAGMILNDACDAVWDRNHRPERPIPSGRISLQTVWMIGLTWMIGGAALMVFAGGASGVFTSLLVAAIVAYDLYHKPWAGSVVVMGACRTLLYLAAGSAVMANDSMAVIWGRVGEQGALLGLYIVALTLVARGEAKGGMPCWLRWICLGLLVLPAVWCGSYLLQAPMTVPSVVSWLLIMAFLGWTAFALRRMSKGGPAIGQAVGLLLAGIPMVDAMLVTPVSWTTGVWFCLLPPFLRLWQRWIAAT